MLRTGSDYRAIDPKEPDGKGAVFTLMDPDHTGFFIAEDKTGAKDVNPPLYAYYFVSVDASGDLVDVYDFTKRDWRRLPADLKKRLVPGLSLRLVEDFGRRFGPARAQSPGVDPPDAREDLVPVRPPARWGFELTPA